MMLTLQRWMERATFRWLKHSPDVMCSGPKTNISRLHLTEPDCEERRLFENGSLNIGFEVG